MKKLLLPMLAILLATACQKEIIRDNLPEEIAGVAAKGPALKIEVCHYDALTNTWHMINISSNAWAAHQAHGDVWLDQDGDGYFLTNECGKFPDGDCDDTNAAINPGALEICNNGIDDNCNGEIDESGCIEVVTICDKLWMLKNLDVDHYRNGDPIPQVTDPTAWAGLTTGAWCYYDNDPANGAIYGKLYNWHAVNDPRGLTPKGWHTPSIEDWFQLVDCLGGFSFAGDKLKEAGTTHWLNFNTGTNESGFTALPGGGRGRTWDFNYNFISSTAFFWSSTEYGLFDGWHLWLSNGIGFAFVNGLSRENGFSVRCLRD